MSLSRLAGGGARLIGKAGVPSQSLYPPVSVAPGSSAGAFGSWVEVVSSVAAEQILLQVSVFELGSIYDLLYLRLGAGASGSEVVIGTAVGGEPASATGSNYAAASFQIPPRIAAGDRLSVSMAAAASGPSAHTLQAVVTYASLANLEGA